ncbi:MAG: CBS domain-containing protein [Desulfobacterales bacterium]|nr:CBS domain-containing protein [Desulfobacterales bacterium]
MSSSLFDFLSTVPPFDLLPEHELRKAAQELTKSHRYRDMVLFVQNKTVLNYVYILLEGRLEKYIQDGDKKTLDGELEEKSIYGALSILFNKSISIRTVQTLEDSTFYCLPKELFLEFCSHYPKFTSFFTDQFSEKMLQEPYVALIAKTPETGESGDQSFLNLTLRDIFSREFASCSTDATIQETAQLMTQKKRSSVVVMDADGSSVGLITDHDMRKKVVAEAYPVNKPVSDIVGGPLITMPAQSQIFEAIMQMMKYDIKHLAVTDNAQKLLGIATEQDLLLAQGRSPVYLMREIQLADSVEQLNARHKQVPGLIKSMIDSGAIANHLNRIITELSDAILKKIIGFAIDEMGEPPVDFAFMIMGSEGRKEQTLKTDQDNAIVFADVPKNKEKEVQSFFLALGEKVCNWLNEAGYSLCEYEIMARNPKWCQPLSKWKQYFHQWIHEADPESLLHSSIFFDFRLGFGQADIIEELRTDLFKSLSGWAGFYRHFAENALHFKPPLDFFGNLILKTREGRKNSLDIKTPMRLIVDFARIYALQNRIATTNTMERLEEVQRKGALEKQDYEELALAYGFLMHLRLAHQVNVLVEEKQNPDNLIEPNKLTHIERQSLKEAFKRIKIAQGKMRMDLTQDIGIT